MPQLHGLRLRNIILAPLLAIAAIWLVCQVVARGLAAYADETGRADLAQQLAGSSGQAASVAAQAALQRGDRPTADRLALRALADSPLDGRALRVRAIVGGVEEGREPGVAQLTLGGQLGWRDTPTQLLLVAHALRQGDYVVATERADALLRRRRLMEQMFALLRAASADPVAVSEVAARIADDPAWRAAFMENLAPLSPAELDGQARLIRAMVAAGTPPKPGELTTLLMRQLADRDYEGARTLWLAVGEGPRLVPGNALADGDFTSIGQQSDDLETNGPFEWSVRSGVGASARIDEPSFAPTDPALVADTDGTVTLDLARQILTLAPGRYRLSVDAASAGADPFRAFRWSVACLPDEAPITGKPVRLARRANWAQFATDIEIPGGCPAQVVKLSAQRADIPGSVEAWFDRVRISAR